MSRSFSILLISLTVAFVSCNKGNKQANSAPDTQVVPHVINLEGENRLKTTVNLAWHGTDKDGYIVGYEYTLDNINWVYTTRSDTTLIFEIPEGSDTTDIEFYVRAIDNLQSKDPSPSYLKIPIINTPPVATFNRGLSSSDTTLIVSSIHWDASDADGFENLKEVQIKINAGNWYTLDKRLKSLTLIPTNPSVAGTGNAKIYLQPTESLPNEIDGLVVGDTNSIFIKAIDISGSESEIDTLTGLFVRQKKANLLVVGGDRTFNNFYKTRISNVVNAYDYIDFVSDGGKNQPTSWNTTFFLMISQYTKLCIYSDKQTYVNPATGVSSLILEASARPIEQFNNNGGKVFTIGYFDNPIPENSLIFDVYPIQSVDSTSKGLFLARSDSAMIPQEIDYPVLGTVSFASEISFFKESGTATVIYKGTPDNSSGYTGPTTLGVKQVIGGKTDMVFIAAGLNIFSKDYTKVDSLFHKVLNKEFN